MGIVRKDLITSELFVDEKGKARLRHTQNVGEILKQNEEMRKDRSLWGKNKNTKFVAQIPEATFQELERKGIAYDNKELNKWLERNPQHKVTRKKL